MSWTLRDTFSCNGKKLSNEEFLSNRIIIETFNPVVPDNWFAAGRCRAIYNVTDVGETTSQWEQLALNEKRFLSFEPVAIYRIFIESKPWIQSLNIKIWEFI